jgi:hypothetical protein
MKRKKLTTTAALLAAIATFTVVPANALTSIQVQEIRKAVLSVPVPEMPAKAAELVTKAEKKDRQATAVTAVRAVVLKHRAAGPLVISAISKAAPELAPAVAVAAAEVATEQAPLIARAAAVSAPSQATEVIAAVSDVVPAQAGTIEATVSPVVINQTQSAPTVSAATVPPVSVAQTSVSPIANQVNQLTTPSIDATKPTLEASPVAHRRAASTPPATGGTVTISNRPINTQTGGAGNGNFPLNAPVEAKDPVVLYNTPPSI